jgi:fatty-acyl-CoA synthase
LCAGYHGDTELTGKYFADGWFRTSDVGFCPEPGRLIIAGRADDALNLGGNKVHPQPIEDRARNLQGVRDVILVCGDGAVNELHVFVEHDVGTPADQIDAPLVRVLREFIPPPVNMVPHYASSLPRGPTGKVQRYRLREAIKRPG